MPGGALSLSEKELEELEKARDDLTMLETQLEEQQQLIDSIIEENERLNSQVCSQRQRRHVLCCDCNVTVWRQSQCVVNRPGEHYPCAIHGPRGNGTLHAPEAAPFSCPGSGCNRGTR